MPSNFKRNAKRLRFSRFRYCSRLIEMERKCPIQCDYCSHYFYHLEHELHTTRSRSNRRHKTG